MARAKSSKEGNSGDTQGVSVSGTERQNQKFDPSLVSLFAQSVSKNQMQSTYLYSVDVLPARRCKGRRQTSSPVRKPFDDA